MKKYQKYLFTAAVIIPLCFWGIRVYSFERLKPKHSKAVHTDFGQIYYSPDAVTQDSIQHMVKLIEKSLKATDQTLAFEPASDLKVLYFFGEKKISSAFPKHNIIRFYHFNAIYPPYIHEYIHTQMGSFEEYWFTEGYTTYLSLYIKSKHPELQRIYDINDNWFIQIKNNNQLCDIDDLWRKYDEDGVRNLIRIEEDNPKLNTFAEKVDYYKLSAAFCEYLSKKVGFTELLTMAKNEKYSSIRIPLEQDGFSVDEHFERWVDERFQKTLRY
ncbi:MAG: hypothetical protein AAGI23_12060 [Bacteroidota bacterium]